MRTTRTCHDKQYRNLSCLPILTPPGILDSQVILAMLALLLASQTNLTILISVVVLVYPPDLVLLEMLDSLPELLNPGGVSSYPF